MSKIPVLSTVLHTQCNQQSCGCGLRNMKHSGPKTSIRPNTVPNSTLAVLSRAIRSPVCHLLFEASVYTVTLSQRTFKGVTVTSTSASLPSKRRHCRLSSRLPPQNPHFGRTHLFGLRHGDEAAACSLKAMAAPLSSPFACLPGMPPSAIGEILTFLSTRDASRLCATSQSMADSIWGFTVFDADLTSSRPQRHYTCCIQAALRCAPCPQLSAAPPRLQSCLRWLFGHTAVGRRAPLTLC